MPPRERYRSSSETKELSSYEALKEQFSKIISVHVDADNVDSFLEKALNQLILYTHAVTLAYKEESQSADTTITKKLEDTALAHYNLPSIEEYFEGIEKKQQIIGDAQALIDSLVSEETVITPPDRGGSIRTGNGHGTFENPATQKRLMLLLYLLKVDFDITLNPTDIQKGIVTRTMMRSESYVALSVTEKDRIVYVCDEIGNATFVFDTTKLKEIHLTIEQLNLLTKDEKNILITENPGIGIRLVYSKFYRENVATLLEDTIPSSEAFVESTKQKAEFKKETSDVPQVITDELHPWRGFLEKKNEEGEMEHLGAIRTIAKSLNLSKSKIGSSVKGFSSERARDLVNNEVDLYSLEQVQAKLKDYLALPQVSLEGEWKGFLEKKNEEGEVENFGAVLTIAKKLNLSEWKINSSLEGIVSYKGKDTSGNEITLYSLEQVQAKLKDYLALPQVSTEGVWKGFLEKENEEGMIEHFGPIKAIAQRMNMSHSKIKPSVKDFFTLKGKDVTGNEVSLYSLEQVQAKLKDYLALPQVSSEGVWKGFLEKKNEEGMIEHFGAISTIAKRFDLDPNTLKLMVEDIFLVEGRDLLGRKNIFYSIEQIEAKLKKRFASPRVDREGDWIGFYKRVTKDGIIEYYGTILALSQRVNLSTGKISSVCNELLPLEGLDTTNRETNLYSLEQVQAKLKDYLALPQVSSEGVWKGFLEKKNEEGVIEHFGAVLTIAKKLNLSQYKIEFLVKDFSTLKGKSAGGKEIDLYSFEQIAKKLGK